VSIDTATIPEDLLPLSHPIRRIQFIFDPTDSVEANRYKQVRLDNPKRWRRCFPTVIQWRIIYMNPEEGLELLPLNEVDTWALEKSYALEKSENVILTATWVANTQSMTVIMSNGTEGKLKRNGPNRFTTPKITPIVVSVPPPNGTTILPGNNTPNTLKHKIVFKGYEVFQPKALNCEQAWSEYCTALGNVKMLPQEERLTLAPKISSQKGEFNMEYNETMLFILPQNGVVDRPLVSEDYTPTEDSGIVTIARVCLGKVWKEGGLTGSQKSIPRGYEAASYGSTLINSTPGARTWMIHSMTSICPEYTVEYNRTLKCT
jgi:hypothetical protein